MFGSGGTKFKKSKSKHSEGSSGSNQKAAISHLMISTTGVDNPRFLAKSDHSDKNLGFFAKFRKTVAGLGGTKDAKSQGVIDHHMDHGELLDLAADLGCISAEE